MPVQKSSQPRNYTDKDVETKVAQLRRDIQTWATKHELWHDSGFVDYLGFTNREPSELPVLSCICSDSEGPLIRSLQGGGPPEIENELLICVEN